MGKQCCRIEIDAHEKGHEPPHHRCWAPENWRRSEFNGSLAHTLLILMDGSYVLRNIKADPQIPKVRHTDFLRISVKLSRRPHPQNAHCQF